MLLHEAYLIQHQAAPLHVPFQLVVNFSTVFAGMKSDETKNMVLTGGTNTAKKDHVIVGDFENSFKWGYSDQVKLEVIIYGDPDQTGRDLKAYNEVCLRATVNVGWGILEETAFARVEEA